MSQVTPLQVDILFTLSDLINSSPTIILSDLMTIAPEQYYIKVEHRVLDIKAVRSPADRSHYVELLESAYRFSIGLVAGCKYNLNLALVERRLFCGSANF
jgi:solute carrier family 25 aspartate/glutamate transporter 12/13